MLWKIQEDQSYYQKIYTFLSGSFCTSLSSKKQVRELSRQDLREISDIPKKIDIRRSDVRPEAYWTSFQTKRTQDICMLSINQLSHSCRQQASACEIFLNSQTCLSASPYLPSGSTSSMASRHRFTASFSVALSILRGGLK